MIVFNGFLVELLFHSSSAFPQTLLHGWSFVKQGTTSTTIDSNIETRKGEAERKRKRKKRERQCNHSRASLQNNWRLFFLHPSLSLSFQHSLTISLNIVPSVRPKSSSRCYWKPLPSIPIHTLLLGCRHVQDTRVVQNKERGGCKLFSRITVAIYKY